jgi:dienelactone hydrolase
MRLFAVFALTAFMVSPAMAQTTEELVSAGDVPYILNRASAQPKYVVILFPGGAGTVDPRMQDGRLVYGYKGNFLVRSRPHIVDEEFATVTTNTTQDEERIQAVLDDLKRRFPAARVYLMGTSNGTGATMALAGYLSDRIAGVIHTSSRSEIRLFDARKYRNRHLVVHHKDDICRVTPFFAAEESHLRFGNDFIAMEGGISQGDPCEAFSHHGYNGIERETIEAIKKWIRSG